MDTFKIEHTNKLSIRNEKASFVQFAHLRLDSAKCVYYHAQSAINQFVYTPTRVWCIRYHVMSATQFAHNAIITYIALAVLFR